MKFKDSNGDWQIIVWGDHWPGCDRCREVSLDKSASFANACAQGSPLLMEELAKRQAPVTRQKAKDVKDWAEKAGVFKMGGAKEIKTLYVEDK